MSDPTSESVGIRVNGNKLFVYGKRIENKSQGISKKIIDKVYELPRDIDTFSSHVTFPSPIIMQIDFSSKYSPAPLVQSSRYSSPQKLNDSNAFSSSYIHSSYDEPPGENRHSDTHQIPIRQLSNNSIDSSLLSTRSISPTYKFHQSVNDRLINKNNTLYKQTFTETHHQHSDSPTLFNINQDRFQSNMNSNCQNMTPSLDTNSHVFMNNNDFIVQVEQAIFYRQIILPSNIDLSSLSLNYHYDRKLYITIKLLDQYSSFKYI
ncbi:unnamed protein product [Rotaria sordida]|uniref:SHSP domain-containing protein n=2 Tax=Rotaria sordida TaxID=392033 RepID=A0A819UAK7_9BILA|nr:unnamed protein product [Rotaria sordida]